MSDVKKSKVLMYLSSILIFQGFIGPILYVFYTMYMGLSVSQYLFCDGLLFLIMALVEIPSGMVADYFGRKRVLLFSKVAIIIGMIILLLFRSFIGAIIVAVIYGIFGALESGIQDSIIYEIFERKQLLKDYEFTNARTEAVGFVVSIIYSVATGYLTQINITLPVILDLAFCIILFVFVCILLENDIEKSPIKKSFNLPQKIDTLNVLPIILLAGMISSVLRGMYSFYQPILTGLNLPTIWLGYAAAAYNIISSFSAFIYSKLRNSIGKWGFMFFLVLIQVISTFGMAYFNTLIVLFFIFLQQFQRGIIGPFLYMQVNNYISSESGKRVTLMSIYFFVITVMSSFFLWISSILTQSKSMGFTLRVTTIVVNTITISLFIIYFHLDKKKIIKDYSVNNT